MVCFVWERKKKFLSLYYETILDTSCCGDVGDGERGFGADFCQG